MAFDWKKAHSLSARAAYLLPFFCALWILIGAAVPHLWFVYGGEARETLDLFELVGNTWESCIKVLEQSSSAAAEQSFAYVMRAAVIVFWVTLVLYLLFALMSAVCSLAAFAMPPTDRYANRVKRIFHLLCPNRVIYVMFCVFPVIPSLFATLLGWCYGTFLGIEVKLFWEGHSDLLAASLSAVLCTALFLLTLGHQRDARMDLFRIYKKRSDVARRGEESL